MREISQKKSENYQSDEWSAAVELIKFLFRAVSVACTNAHWPDLHGHYREAQFTQTKHHWWWKANWIFNQIESLKSFQGIFYFLKLSKHFMINCRSCLIFGGRSFCSWGFSPRPQITRKGEVHFKIQNWYSQSGNIFEKEQCSTKSETGEQILKLSFIFLLDMYVFVVRIGNTLGSQYFHICSFVCSLL